MKPRFFSLVTALGLLALLAGACSNQGEGQPCDPNAGNNGSDDCQSGLVCTNVQRTSWICCPPGEISSALACNPGSALPDASTDEAAVEAAPQSDASDASDASEDVATEGAVDSSEAATSDGSDASTEAETSAPTPDAGEDSADASADGADSSG